MDNIPASPQILVPNVPASFCPKGNISEIFQAFVDEVLKNATLSVPGIGQVTPEQITEINATLIDLQNQINANKIYFLSGEVELSNGDAGYNVDFTSTPMPNADYFIGLTLVTSTTGMAAPETIISVDDGSPAITGFTINVDNGSSGDKVMWMAIGKNI